jgi:hypothetical protein
MDAEAVRRLLAGAPTVDWPRPHDTVAIRRFEVDGEADPDHIERWVRDHGGDVESMPGPGGEPQLRQGRTWGPRPRGTSVPYYVVPLAALAEPE